MMSRDIYRAEIALLKIIPMIIAAVYLMNTVLSYLGINLYVLSMAGGLSVLPWLFLYIYPHLLFISAYITGYFCII